MDSKQIDKAMLERTPVMYEGRRYERISQYISWYDFSGIKPVRRLSVMLPDGRSTIIVPANKVTSVEGENEYA